MMKPKFTYFIILIFITLSIIGCGNEKKILLPKLEEIPLKEVEDYSTVYVFYDEPNDDYKINKNNLISSTNWVFNIDRRLSLAQAGDALDLLQTKKESPNIHSKPDSRNYFSVADMKDETLAFIDFTPTRFRTFLKDRNNETVRVCDKNHVIYQEKNITIDNFINDFYTRKTIWDFDGAMSFNDFLYIYQLLGKRGIIPGQIFVTQ